MLTIPPFHIGYANSANRNSRNVASSTWAIFLPNNKFLDYGGIFLGRATNKFVEYEVLIALITNASDLGIHSLVVRLASELVISQLTSYYYVHDTVLYRKCLRVCLLERSFDVISY